MGEAYTSVGAWGQVGRAADPQDDGHLDAVQLAQRQHRPQQRLVLFDRGTARLLRLALARAGREAALRGRPPELAGDGRAGAGPAHRRSRAGPSSGRSSSTSRSDRRRRHRRPRQYSSNMRWTCLTSLVFVERQLQQHARLGRRELARRDEAQLVVVDLVVAQHHAARAGGVLRTTTTPFLRGPAPARPAPASSCCRRPRRR